MLKLRLRPKKRSRYYIDLLVFPTRKSMFEYRRVNMLANPSKDFEACCVFWRDKTPKLAEIWCYEGSANPASLAHEFIHVGIEYLRRLGKDDLRAKVNDEESKGDYWSKPEEVLCYAVQELLDGALIGLDERA